MHPLFRYWRRLLIYLLVWIEIGVVLGLIGPVSSFQARLEVFAFTIPISLVLGFICLTPLYVCRTVPLRALAWKSVMQNHLFGVLAAIAAMTIAGKLLESVLSSVWPEMSPHFDIATPLFTTFIVMAWLLSTTAHYAFLELESSRRAELLAREAQLKALKSQINPHFLFNSLNSISALTSIDAARAREMCIGLADFLRASLRLGERDTVPFAEELALTNMYLSVEQARFGDRLRLVRDIEPACDSCEIPALLIQPLVENAVKHGIGMMAEGGEILLSGHCVHNQLQFSVSNPFDPDSPHQDRNGIGLRNVRARLEARYGSAAKMQIHATENRYQVTLTMPVKTS